MSKAFRFRFHLGAFAASVFLLFACHLSNTTEPQETFTFPTLKDSIGTADSVLIVLKDQGGRVIDTLFNGKVSGATQFKDLKAPHYDGGRVQIYVEASQNGKPIYKVERGFDPAQGGNIEGTKKIYLTPSLAIQLEKVLTKVREGEAVPMPGYSVIPPTLDDKTVLWVSRSSAVLKVEGNTLLGVAPGFTHLIASLAADTSKKDSLTIEVVSKTAPTKPIDSLILNTDTLVLALGGPSGRFTLRSIPTSASTEATWSLLSGTSIQLATDGLISPVAEGLSRVSAVSKLDITVADTAWVKVLPKQKVDSIRFVLRSLDLFAGGTAESLLVKAYPALAPQGVQLSVQDTALAHLSGTTIQGRREGDTWVYAASTEDPTKKDSIRVSVFPAEKVDSVRLKEDSLVLYVKGESKALTPAIYPATLQKRFSWRSSHADTATVDGTGLVSPVKQGRTWVTVLARADSTKRDSARIIVKKDTPRLKVGPDTAIAKGATVTYAPTAPQEYGLVVMFKWDLNGDGAYDDSATALRSDLSATYPEAKTYSVRFYVRDTEGNDTVVTRNITVIPGAPAVSGASLTNDPTPTWTWTSASESPVRFRYKLNNINLDIGATVTTQKEFTPDTNLTEGNHTLYVQEGDASGNWSPSGSRPIRIDLTKPTSPRIDSTPYSPLNSLRPRFTWKRGNGGAGIFRARIDNPTLDGQPELTDSAFAPTADLGEGARILYVQERDSAGNWSSTTERTIFLAPERILGAGPVSTAQSVGGKMALNNAGLLFIAYTEVGTDSIVAVRYFQNGVWKNLGQTGRKSWEKPTLAIDSRDNIFLGYSWNTSGRSSVLRFDGANWNEAVQTFEEWGGNLNLAVDGSDSLYLAYQVSRSSFVKKRRNFEWDSIGQPIYPMYSGDFQTALSVTKAGQPFFAISVSTRLNVHKFTGASWESAGEQDIETSYPYNLSLETLKSGEPILTMQSPSAKLSTLKLSNGTWQALGNQNFADGLVSKAELAVSPAGEVFVAYFESVLGEQHLTVARLINNTWVKVGSSYSTPSSDHLNLIVDSNGIPYVSFQDTKKNNMITVLRKGFSQN